MGTGEVGSGRAQRPERTRDRESQRPRAEGHNLEGDVSSGAGSTASEVELALPGSRQVLLRSAALSSGRGLGGIESAHILHLQRTYGNRQVSRMIEDARGGGHHGQAGAAHRQVARAAMPTAVQRYPVGASPNADCQTVVSWLDSHSPYKPEWARTQVRFNRSGSIVVSGTAPNFRATFKNPGVTVSKKVDMPQWQPANPAMRQAWDKMWANLRTHETRHEEIANRWKTTLLDRLKALDLEVTANNQAEAQKEANRLVEDEWTSWIAEHQADQDDIDPFTAELVCPNEEEEQSTEGESGEQSAEGEGGLMLSDLWSTVKSWFS